MNAADRALAPQTADKQTEPKELLRHKEAGFSISDLALAEDEYQNLRQQEGLAPASRWWQRLGDAYFQRQEQRVKHRVNRSLYLWLTVLTGWAGGHRFYERRWYLAVFYLALCWTGLPVALAVVDWMIAFPLQADDRGSILI